MFVSSEPLLELFLLLWPLASLSRSDRVGQISQSSAIHNMQDSTRSGGAGWRYLGPDGVIVRLEASP